AIACYEKGDCSVPPNIFNPPMPDEFPTADGMHFLAKRRTDIECQAGQSESCQGTGSQGCARKRTCTENLRWAACEEDCSCTAAKDCKCDNGCPGGTRPCPNGQLEPCSCPKLCPDGFSVDGDRCRWEGPNIGYHSWGGTWPDENTV